MNAGEIKRLTSWLNGLARVCQHRSNTPETEEVFAEIVAQYAAMLAETGIPVSAFNQASLTYVATGNAWFPPFEVIRSRVVEHWSANRPYQAPLIEGPDIEGRLSTWDRSWLNYWRNNIADRRAFEQKHAPRIAQMDPPQRPVARFASLVRKNSPAAWAVIASMESASAR